MKTMLIFSDNRRIHDALATYFCNDGYGLADVHFGCSPPECIAGGLGRAIAIKERVNELAERYGLILSAHCKQIFPAELVKRVRCVNLHPGFNPDTRGWYPQVWAILEGLKIGFTLHAMDEQIDHGAILFRREIPARLSDTSASLYERIIDAEIASIPEWVPKLIRNKLKPVRPESKGNYHSKADFAALCEIDLSEQGTFLDFYNRLRATSFAPFDNAFITDPESGKRIFLRLDVTP